MKRKQYKFFGSWESDREERWLNRMSEKGMQLVDAGHFHYIFEDGAPGEYIYRVELLDKAPDKEELTELTKVYESVGAEYVDRESCCIYLRRKATEGPFEIYSDVKTKIKRNTYSLWMLAGMLFIVLGNINNQLIRYNSYRQVREALGTLPPNHSLYTSEQEVLFMVAFITLHALLLPALAVCGFTLLRSRQRLYKEKSIRE